MARRQDHMLEALKASVDRSGSPAPGVRAVSADPAAPDRSGSPAPAPTGSWVRPASPVEAPVRGAGRGPLTLGTAAFLALQLGLLAASFGVGWLAAGGALPWRPEPVQPPRAPPPGRGEAPTGTRDEHGLPREQPRIPGRGRWQRRRRRPPHDSPEQSGPPDRDPRHRGRPGSAGSGQPVHRGRRAVQQRLGQDPRLCGRHLPAPHRGRPARMPSSRGAARRSRNGDRRGGGGRPGRRRPSQGSRPS